MKTATPWLILLLLPLSASAEDPIIGAFGIPLGKPDGQPFDAEIEEFCIIRGNPQTYTCEYTTNKPNAMFNEKVSVLHSNRSDRKILMITANGKENHLSESACKANLEKIKTTLISKYRGSNREIKLDRGGFGLIISNKKNKNQVTLACTRSEGNNNLLGAMSKRFDLKIQYTVPHDEWGVAGTNESGL